MNVPRPSISGRLLGVILITHLGLLVASLLLNQSFLIGTGNIIRVTLPALCLIALVQVVALSRSGCGAQIGLRKPIALTWLLGLPLGFVIVSIALQGGFLNIRDIDAQTMLIFLTAIVLIGFIEEITFRGFLFTYLSERYPDAITVVVSSVLFGVAHAIALVGGSAALGTLTQIAGTTLFGLLLGILRLRSGSLVLGIALHIGWNFAVLSGKPMSPFVEPVFVQLAGGVFLVGLAAAVGLTVAYRLSRRSTPRMP
ncbi:CPBP family intramembrane glutamic endopeptidase [Miltoncostaea oceani]|uniref:CPBP family intramembrane glutamic endopeptidase n=1 Tax=Miltoncostaea oceani TaxID=2843216 RepID=UPI001C3C9A7E|nr:CPBP family intramembrane glutamic endopeptidase [Miltoncostaea oceani]